MAAYPGNSFTTVTAYAAVGGALATIYSDSGMTVPTPNPFVCYGNYLFYGAAGLYIVKGDFTRLIGSGGGGGVAGDYVVVSDGAQPPTAVDDGAGSFVYTRYTP